MELLAVWLLLPNLFFYNTIFYEEQFVLTLRSCKKLKKYNVMYLFVFLTVLIYVEF